MENEPISQQESCCSSITDYVDKQLVVDTDAYSIGDNVAGLNYLDINSPGGGGRIVQVSLFDDNNKEVPFDLWLFHEQPTEGEFSDNETFAPTSADRKKRIRKLSISANDYDDIDGLGQVDVSNLAIDYKEDDNGRLWFNLVTPLIVTFTDAAALYLRLYYLGN